MGVQVGRFLRVPRRTVRVRLTVLYASLFFVSGVALLGLTDLLMARLIRGSGAIQMGNLEHTAHSARIRRLMQAASAAHRPASLATHLIQLQTVQALQQETARDLDRLIVVSGVALAVMLLVSALVGWLIAGRVLRPLHAMTAATRRISEQRLHERLGAQGPDDEIKDLSDTIDGLLARLESAFAAQRRFVANASHEMRTPLAMMRTSVDVAEAKPGPVPPQVTTLAGKVREGLDQADRLLEGLLALARAQHGTAGHTDTVDLAAILADAISGFAGAIAGRALLLRRAGGTALVRGNRVLLARLAGNLVDNAIRYNQAGGCIRVETGADEAAGAARLIVQNDGPVLDDASVRELGQPFRRLGADRTGSATGSGLGLSIVEAITTAHGGTLRLEARPHGGLTVIVLLPAARASPSLPLTSALIGAGAAR